MKPIYTHYYSKYPLNIYLEEFDSSFLNMHNEIHFNINGAVLCTGILCNNCPISEECSDRTILKLVLKLFPEIYNEYPEYLI